MFYKVKIIPPNGWWCMPRGPAPSGRGPGGNLARGAHAPGDPQPDPSWGWDVAGNPIEEADGWRPVPPGVDPLADPERWEAWLAATDSGDPPPDPESDRGWYPDPAGAGDAGVGAAGPG